MAKPRAEKPQVAVFRDDFRAGKFVLEKFFQRACQPMALSFVILPVIGARRMQIGPAR
jgi:hypothetical protein